jgi:hypothetical protein
LAILHARRACQLTKFQDALALNTLALGYAAAGNFPDALTAAQQARVLAQASNQQALAADLDKRIELYKAARAN